MGKESLAEAYRNWASASDPIEDLAPIKKATWDIASITGDGEAQERIRQMLTDLAAWKDGELPWEDITASIILEGEPGSGKTYLARQIATCLGSSQAILTSYADWQAKGALNEFLKAMKESFAEAKKTRPSVLFIDEIDSFGTRYSSGHNASYDRKAINGFLAELDMSQLQGVLVIGACNDASSIDPAILRDGRFDDIVQMEPPGPEMVANIIRKPLTGIVSDGEIETIAKMLVGVSPAKITGTIRKIKSECRYHKRDFDREEIFKRILPPEHLREKIWYRVAAHECGHAIAGHALNLGETKRVLMRSDGSGFAQSLGQIGEGLLVDYENRITHLMAGRAAEKLLTGQFSGGAGGAPQSDLAKATRLAVAIEYRLGLGTETSYKVFKDNEWENNMTLREPIQCHVDDGYGRALDILSAQQDLLEEMTQDLMTERVLRGDRLQYWLDQVKKEPTSKKRLPRMTPTSILNQFKNSTLRFRSGPVTLSAFRSAQSIQLLVALTIIGWSFGLQRKSPSGDIDVTTACSEGLDMVETNYPDRSIVNLDHLTAFSKHLLAQSACDEIRKSNLEKHYGIVRVAEMVQQSAG